MKRTVLIVGAGKRVKDAALPALARAGGDFELRAVCGRSAKTIEALDGRRYDVVPLATLDRARSAGVDLIYVVVGKGNVPAVLRELRGLGLGGADLLIETPVLLLKHFRHRGLLGEFRSASVAEDCVELPWYDAVHAAQEKKHLGAVTGGVFHRSAYAYHGVAMVKSLSGQQSVPRAVRKKSRDGGAVRRFDLADGSSFEIVEPRDYGAGHFVIRTRSDAFADKPGIPGAKHVLEAIVEERRCVGFRLAGVETRLDPQEVELMALDAAAAQLEPDAAVTARMDGMKRVGFRRIWRRFARGGRGYDVDLALEDMIVDAFLERFGRWHSNLFTDPRAATARTLYNLASRLLGR